MTAEIGTELPPIWLLQVPLDSRGTVSVEIDLRLDQGPGAVGVEIDLRLDQPRLALDPGPVVGVDEPSPAARSYVDVRSLLDRHLAGSSLYGMVLRHGSVADRGAGRTYRFVKRATDIIVALVVLVLAVPMLVIAGLAVRFTSPGPIFYRHRRYGAGGVEFMMLKLRSMVDGADGLLGDMDDLARRGEVEALDEVVFKAPDDPRITPVGRFLRRTNIDESPQLLNVLAGRMSLVGPRPLVSKEIDTLSDRVNEQRHSVRPGITCLWQVVRREDTTFAERMALDLLYVELPSAYLDTCLLAMTPIAIARGTRSH